MGGFYEDVVKTMNATIGQEREEGPTTGRSTTNSTTWSSPSLQTGVTRVFPANSVSLLVDAIEETTRILYKHSPDLDRWLAAPPPKVYVYDTLPKEWSDIRMISQCIEQKMLDFNASSTPRGWNNCFWEPEICDDEQDPGNHKRKKFMNYRANYNNDVAYQKWFQGYPFRTKNASEADFFVVPYPHWSHCICHKNMSLATTRCQFVAEELQTFVLDHLAYYSKKKERHLFLYGVDYEMVRDGIRDSLAESMTISLGPTCSGRKDKLCGHFVTPYLDTSPMYQPRTTVDDAFDGNDKNKASLWWWIERNRSFTVGAAMSTSPSFPARQELVTNQSIHLGDASGSANTIKIMDLTRKRRQVRQSVLRGLYNESIFCPILPGDHCPQKRFFDVILNGCIPVVPSFIPSDEAGHPTFWVGTGVCSIRRTYPWSMGTFFTDNLAGIDYQSLVVQFDGACGMACMKPALENVVGNSTEMKRLRTNLKEISQLVAFGLGDNMYKHADAFSAMLVAIRHYTYHLDNHG